VLGVEVTGVGTADPASVQQNHLMSVSQSFLNYISHGSASRGPNKKFGSKYKSVICDNYSWHQRFFLCPKFASRWPPNPGKSTMAATGRGTQTKPGWHTTASKKSAWPGNKFPYTITGLAKSEKAYWKLEIDVLADQVHMHLLHIQHIQIHSVVKIHGYKKLVTFGNHRILAP
jgi:hypothetical protein